MNTFFKNCIRITIVLLVVFLIAWCATNLQLTDEDKYWKTKEGLNCEQGETLLCLKEGIKNLLEENEELKVEDITIIAEYPGTIRRSIRALVLFKDKTVKEFSIDIDAWGIKEFQLFYSIVASRDDEESTWNPDTIRVPKKWLIATENYGDWGSAENLPSFTEWSSEEFFETVLFKLNGDEIRITDYYSTLPIFPD